MPPRRLVYRNPFLHPFQQAIRRGFEPGGKGDAAGCRQQPCQIGGERLLESNVPPPGNGQAGFEQAKGQGFERGRRCGFIDEMEAPLPGFLNQRLDLVDQDVGRSYLIARDIVQPDIAERALLPITAVCNGQLVPMAFRPESMHGVQAVED